MRLAAKSEQAGQQRRRQEYRSIGSFHDFDRFFGGDGRTFLPDR
jgi:hypothetical protein